MKKPCPTHWGFGVNILRGWRSPLLADSEMLAQENEILVSGLT